MHIYLCREKGKGERERDRERERERERERDKYTQIPILNALLLSHIYTLFERAEPGQTYLQAHSHQAQKES